MKSSNTREKCKHDNGQTMAGQTTYQVTGICDKCGKDLDFARNMSQPPQPPLQDKQDWEIESNDFIEAMTAWDGSEWTKKGLKQAQNGMRKIISKAIQIAVEEAIKEIVTKIDMETKNLCPVTNNKKHNRSFLRLLNYIQRLKVPPKKHD